MGRMYDLVASLTDRPLEPPRHEICLTEEDVEHAKDIIMQADHAGPNTPPEDLPEPRLLAYSRFVLKEYNAGRARFLDPSSGVQIRARLFDGCRPYHAGHSSLTGPLVSSDQRDDLLRAGIPRAIMQDNRRANLFGTGSAGAGGVAEKVRYKNLVQIDYITITKTVGRRLDQTLIEGRGVLPDRIYQISLEDMRSDFSLYRNALLSALEDWVIGGARTSTTGDSKSG